jgi:tripartite-type tricarboxylate transporter receptor subunit TctC
MQSEMDRNSLSLFIKRRAGHHNTGSPGRAGEPRPRRARMHSRWNYGWILAVACTVLFGTLPVGAQEYPSKPGATGIIGSQYVYNSKPDGYTLLVAGGSETVSVPHFKSLPFNPINDFDPVIRLMVERIGFYVRTDSPWKTMKDFIADAKQNPEKYTYATSGVGGLHHATVLVTEKRTGIRLTHVPHKGGAETLTALAGGHVSVAMASPNEAYALVQGGRVRCLAITALERSPTEPNAPTMRELGYDVYIDNQKGFVFPKGVPQPIRQKLHDAVKKAYDDPQFKASAEKLKLELSYLNGEDFRKALKSMYDQIGESVKK